MKIDIVNVKYKAYEYYDVNVELDKLIEWHDKKYGMHLDLSDTDEVQTMAMEYAFSELQPRPIGFDDPELIDPNVD